MEIASSGDEEVALLGQLKVFGGLAGCVSAVVHFDASQSGGFQVADQGAQAVCGCSHPGRMRQHRYAAGLTNPSHRLGRFRQLTIDKGRAAVGQIAVEGFLGRCDEFLLHQQPGDVGAAHRFGTGQGPHFFIGNRDAQLVEALDDLRIACVAAVPQGAETLGQERIGPVQKIAEDMEFALAEARADFDAGDDFDAEFGPDGRGFRNPLDNVVVGDRERGYAGLLGKGHYVAGGKAAVRMGGMEVKVDATHRGSSGPAFCATKRAV
ncbi:hypothetical protein NSND_60400 [Nitrospira sp. ND1]|nr:hypothetical protein NSND_60400 [Nitrospira sp. ND1]